MPNGGADNRVQVKDVATGELRWTTPDDAQAGIAAGAYEAAGKVILQKGTGERYAVEQEAVAQQRLGAQRTGASAREEATRRAADIELAGGAGEAAKAFGEGALSSLTLGVLGGPGEEAEFIGRGATREARRAREQAVARGAGTLAGDIAAGVATGGAKTAAGLAGRAVSLTPGGIVARAAEKIAAGGTGARAVRYAAGGALEGAAGAAADLVAEAQISDDPVLTGEALGQRVLGGSILGGGAGGLIGAGVGALERRAAGQATDRLGRAGEVAPGAPPEVVAEAARRTVDDMLGATERVPYADMIPRKARSPEQVAERVQGVYRAVGDADQVRQRAQAEIDTLNTILDTLPEADRAALRDELGAAVAGHKRAAEEAREWLSGRGKAQRAYTRARLDEIRVAEAEAKSAERIAREQAKTAVVKAKVSPKPEAPPKPARSARMPKGWETGPGIDPKTPRRTGIPGFDDDMEAIRVVSAEDLAGRVGTQIDGLQPERIESIRRGWKEGGLKLDPIRGSLKRDGTIEITSGRHRLAAAKADKRKVALYVSRHFEDVAEAAPRTGADAVRDFLAKYKRKGQDVVPTVPGAKPRAGGALSVDRLVAGDVSKRAEMPMLDLAQFRQARPGEVAERIAAARARDPDMAIRARLAAEEAEKAAELGPVGRILEPDTDDAVDVLGRLDDASARLSEAVQRLRAKAAGTAPAPTAAPGLEQVAGTPVPSTARRLGAMAERVGQGLEIASMLGLPVPSPSGLPGIGPAVGAFLKARMAWRALRGTGATLPATGGARAAAGKAAIENAAQQAAARVAELGARAARSPRLPGLVGRQIGRGLSRALGLDLAERQRMALEVERVRSAVAQGGFGNAIAGEGAGIPATAVEAGVAAADRGLSYLAEHAPPIPGQGTPWEMRRSLTPVQAEQWEQRRTAVTDPVAALDSLASGVVAPWALDAVRVVYPAMIAAYRAELEAHRDTLAALPRWQRLAIGASFDLPLDPTQMPTYPRLGLVPSAAASAPTPKPSAPSVRPRAAELAATREEKEDLSL